MIEARKVRLDVDGRGENTRGRRWDLHETG